MKAINPMIQEAIDLGKDTSGLCTVRELAAEILNQESILGEYVCELMFTDETGRCINIECAVTFVDGAPYARQWTPKISEFIGKQITLCVTSNDEVKDAINICLMFANGRNGHWIAIPFMEKENDPLAQRGYIGFKIDSTGHNPTENVNLIYKQMTGS